MTRRTFVAANWKMNGSKSQIAALADALVAGQDRMSATEVVVCPPSVYLAQVQQLLSGSAIRLGAQNLHMKDSGAFTGEISAPMLNDFDCSYVIVGHSERRTLFGETDETVVAKFSAAQAHELTPVLCVGESAAEREAGSTEAVVRSQLEAVLSVTGVEAFHKAVVAYEPVWAIGSGTPATPQDAQAVHAMIRSTIGSHNGPGATEVAEKVRILYGGSVNADNAGSFSLQPDIDGALVGGASLVAEEFITICSRMSGESN